MGELPARIAGIGDGTVPRLAGVVVDNTDAVYQFDGDPALSAAEQEFNDSIPRIAQDPQGRVARGLDNAPVVDGRIPVPVLTLHDLGDLFVPFLMEQVYAQRVADNGRSDLLVQRAIRGVGHCDFTPTELIEGFRDLVTWVEAGVRPAGGVLSIPPPWPRRSTGADSPERHDSWDRSARPVRSRKRADTPSDRAHPRARLPGRRELWVSRGGSFPCSTRG